jgi:alpha-tubulin suppressor-like RCC1 family protein
MELIESPRKIEGEIEIQMISKVQCGSGFTLALSCNGLVFGWGLGRSGIHGLGDQDLVKDPKKLNFFGCKIDGISSGGKHSFSWSNHIEFNIPRFTKPAGSCSSIMTHSAGKSSEMPTLKNTNSGLSQSLKQSNTSKKGKSFRSGRKRTTNVPTKTIEVYSWGDGREFRLGQPDQNIYNIPTAIDTSHILTKVHDICCTYRGAIALVDSLDLAIHFKDQIYYYGCIGDEVEEEFEVSFLIKQLSNFFHLEKREIYLVDESNIVFKNDAKVC